MALLNDIQVKASEWWEGWKSPAMLWMYGITAVVVLGFIYFFKVRLWGKKRGVTRRRRRRTRQKPIIIRNYPRR